MSFFGALMGDFMDDDPFFGAHMRQMNSMMNMFSDPFGMVNSQMALTGPRGHPASRNGQLDMMPFGFPAMGLGMNRMLSEFENMAQNGACHSFTSSSVMTMSNGDGRPQVYQETSSMRMGPGGVKETKKTVCDSRSGTKKMAIGHHIGDRAHIIERQQNMRTGDQEENQEFINLDEDEADEFNQEWETKTRRHLAVRDRTMPHRNHRQLALPSTAPSSSSSHHSSHGRTSEPRRRPKHTSKHYPVPDSHRSVEIVECSSDEKEETDKEESPEKPEKPETSRKREHSPNQETSNKRHSASKSSDD